MPAKTKSTKNTAAVTKATRRQKVAVSPAPVVEPATQVVRHTSVRQTVRYLLTAGRTIAEITEVLRASFPATAAARLPAKHIAYYKCQLKKELRVAAAS